MKSKNTKKLIRQALREDRVTEDITSDSLIPAAHNSEAKIVLKEDAVLCGMEIAKTVFKMVDPHIQFQILGRDGKLFRAGCAVGRIRGKTRSILKAERTALNFLGYLSGIATKTFHFTQKTKGTKARVYDTRKTTPTLRELEKYAVRCGGGKNHRMNLGDLVMIKDNHLAISNGQVPLRRKIQEIRRKHKCKVELEVDNLGQLIEALKARPDIILLDNMRPAQMKKAVSLRKKAHSHIPLEASGGVTLKNVAAVARSGVDRIAVGELTHSARAIDFSLELKS